MIYDGFLNGFLWILMDSYGFLWVLMDLFYGLLIDVYGFLMDLLWIFQGFKRTYLRKINIDPENDPF